MTKISYCITCHNETVTLSRLLNLLLCIKGNDEIIVQADSKVTTETETIIKSYGDSILYYTFPLNNDYGTFKNKFIQMASGDFIFAIDSLGFNDY